MNTEVCEHGSLQRSCRICDLEDDLNLMYRTLDGVRAHRSQLLKLVIELMAFADYHGPDDEVLQALRRKYDEVLNAQVG